MIGKRSFNNSSFFDENLVEERRKTQRYQPGSFLEMNDLCGGRKVVMVGRDGVTFWDSLNTDEATPIVVHPVLQMAEIGTFVNFIRENNLALAAIKVIEHLRVHMDARRNDSLFIMRVLWCLSQKSVGKQTVFDDAALQSALRDADAQEVNALRVVHRSAQRYNALTAHA
jgi:hypothetical protein